MVMQRIARTTMPMSRSETITTTTLPEADARRASHRVRTVYRVVRVQTAHDQGLGRVRNVSDGGMKLTLTMPVMLGDTVRVALSNQTEVEGQVVWTNGNDCGLKFVRNIDSIDVLRTTAEHNRSADTPTPSLQADVLAVAKSERGLIAVTVHEVSLRGMKLSNDGSFVPGLPVKVSFGSGLERRGVIRWASDDVAGLMLFDHFAVEELGAISALS